MTKVVNIFEKSCLLVDFFSQYTELLRATGAHHAENEFDVGVRTSMKAFTARKVAVLAKWVRICIHHSWWCMPRFHCGSNYPSD